MFEVRLFVEDKKLTKFLWAIDGQIVGMPQLIPVRGATAVKEKGSSKVKATTDGNSVTSHFHTAVLEDGRSELTTTQLKDLLEKVGGRRTSGSTHIKTLVERGILKSAGYAKYKVLA